jgi:hypothetical protein
MRSSYDQREREKKKIRWEEEEDQLSRGSSCQKFEERKRRRSCFSELNWISCFGVVFVI